MVAFLYIAHGTQKLFGVPSAEPRAGVALASLLGMAAVIEIVGGALLLLGLFTRPVAFVLAGEMMDGPIPARWAPYLQRVLRIAASRPCSSASRGCTSRPRAPVPGASTRCEGDRAADVVDRRA